MVLVGLQERSVRSVKKILLQQFTNVYYCGPAYAGVTP